MLRERESGHSIGRGVSSRRKLGIHTDVEQSLGSTQMDVDGQRSGYEGGIGILCASHDDSSILYGLDLFSLGL